MVFIKKVLEKENLKYSYMDGQVESSRRQDLIDDFNSEDSDTFAFCSTTGVGGLGITLTGADRVIVYDPDWNPANDSQAVDRAFRLGQTKNVVVYRFVTCETIEDKIYRRQVSKKGLLEMMNTDAPVRKFFTRDELKSVFAKLEDCSKSSTAIMMNKAHPTPNKPYPELLEDLEALSKSAQVSSISHHDDLFKINAAEEQELDNMLKVTSEDMDSDEALAKQKNEDAKVALALEQKLKRVREEKEMEPDQIEMEEDSLSRKRKKRRLAAKKSGWDEDNYQKWVGTPPQKKKRRKLVEKPHTPESEKKPIASEENPLSPSSHNLPGKADPEVPKVDTPISPIPLQSPKRKLGSKVKGPAIDLTGETD